VYSYKEVRKLKLPTFKRIIKQNKCELIRIAKQPPDPVNMIIYTIFILNTSDLNMGPY